MPPSTIGAVSAPASPAGRGWRPLRPPASDRPQDQFVSSPFARLARVHAFSVAGDALIALALANSLFFSIDPTAARWRIALYLVFTMAPFAVVSPLIGPAIDRAHAGRKWMIMGSAALRVLICIFMVGDLDSLLLFPEAFAILVLGKGYQVAKSAIVPTTVRTDAELVEANSKLSLISGLAGVVAVLPGLLLLQLGGSEWVIGLAAMVFTVAAMASSRLPNTAVAPEPRTEAEREELHSTGIQLASGAMGLLRGVVGFLAFLLAFELRRNDDPTWHFGFIVAASAAGGLLGAALSPRIRRTTGEEDMLIGALSAAVGASLVAAWVGGLWGMAFIALAIGICAGAAKLAFDSIVQRDAPDANRGRMFARFETRFQVYWVIGAFLPVVLPIPARLGMLLVAIAVAFALASYVIGRRSMRERASRPDGTRRRREPEGPASLTTSAKAWFAHLRARRRKEPDPPPPADDLDPFAALDVPTQPTTGSRRTHRASHRRRPGNTTSARRRARRSSP